LRCASIDVILALPTRFTMQQEPVQQPPQARGFEREPRETRLRIAAFVSHPIQYLTPLWRELSQRPGVDLTVFYFSKRSLVPAMDPGFGVSVAWDIDLLAGHRHVFLPRRWPARDPLHFGAWTLNRGVVAALRQGWDAVFVAGYAQANNWLIVAACKLLGIPVVCSLDTTMRSAQAKTLPRRLLKRILLTSYVRQTAAFLALGGHTRAYLAQYGAAPESIFICPGAVDVARFREAVARAGPAGREELRSRWRIPRGAKIVMFCGKLVPWKRPLDLVEAVESLDRSDLVAVFVGDGELREAILSRGGERVRVTGFVNQSEIPLALSLADIFVLPSSFEPYGIVVAEAQCLGVPAIVSDACGCYGEDSVVRPDVSGFVVPTADVVALASRIEALLENRSLHNRMSGEARVQGETQSEVAAANGFLSAVQFARARSA
jgi:glycosyltransferase involved in cell wall biosynthesis